jgi:hypothetical protein
MSILGGKMDENDTISGDITRNKLIWCGHVEAMARTESTANVHEGNKEVVHEIPGKMGYIQV